MLIGIPFFNPRLGMRQAFVFCTEYGKVETEHPVIGEFKTQRLGAGIGNSNLDKDGFGSVIPRIIYPSIIEPD